MSDALPALTIGQKVRITGRPPYVKTAEPMPMLRPPSVIQVGEEGVLLARQPGNTWSVRLRQGAYLLDPAYFEPLSS